MKKISLCLGVIAFLAVAGCNNHNGEKASEKSESKTINIKVSELATTQDLVCGMKLEDGAIADTALYQGKVYGFCSPECKADFLKDPQSRLTQK